MSDVSCRIIEGIIRFMERNDYSLTPLRALLPISEPNGRLVTEKMLRSPLERVAWTTFIQFMQSFPELNERDDVQEAYVHATFVHRMGWIGFAKPILRLFFTVERMFFYINFNLGRSMFANVKSTMERMEDGRIRLTLEIPDRDEDSLAFFKITTKTLRRIPTIGGWPNALVEAQYGVRRCDYIVTLPQDPAWPWRYAKRIKFFLRSSASLSELEQSHEAMIRLYADTLKSESELRQARIDLEARVQDRTQALEAAINRLESEAQVRRAAEDRAALLGSLLNESSQEIFIICAATMRFLMVNNGATRNLGYSSDELLQMTPLDISARPLAEVRQSADDIVSGKANHTRFTSVSRRKNGDTYPVDVHLQKTMWEGREVLVAIIADISDRVRAETERLQLMAELHAAQRQQSVGALAGGVAHEFNNILTPILAHAALIAPELAKGSRGSDSLDRIEKAVNRGRNVVKQILAMSGPSVGVAAPVNLGDIVAEALALFRPTLPSNINLTVTHKSRGKVFVHAVAAEIHQIVLNLLSNAVHALPDAGGAIAVTIGTQGESSVLTVTDDGSGMDEATKNRIFDPFFTTKEAGKGSGIGLSIVRDITARYGATLKVQTSPGKGSTFTIVFPAAAANYVGGGEEGRRVEDAAAAAKVPSYGRVLLVDDEEEIAFVLGEALRFQGFDVTTAVSPRQALDLVKGSGQTFDLVVTDMSMPEMNGIELAKAMRIVSPTLRICLLSGYTHGLSDAVGRANDIVAVFDKPIEPAKLAAAMRSVLIKT